MVATRSQDQASALPREQDAGSDNTELPIRAANNKKRPHDPKTAVANPSDTKRRKVEEPPRTDEHDTSEILAAVVIPTSQPGNTSGAGEQARETGVNGSKSQDADEVQGEEIRPPLLSRDQTTIDRTQPDTERLGEHMRPWTPASIERESTSTQAPPFPHGRPWTPASNEKPALQGERAPCSDQKSIDSREKKTKNSGPRDPRMDVTSLVDARHRNPPADSETKSSCPRPSSRHKRFGSEDPQYIPLVPYPKSSVSQISDPSKIDEEVQEASSEDEAPEVVTQATGLEKARFTAAEAAKAVEAQRAVEKQKRKERDRLLKTQSKAPKKQPKEADPLDKQHRTSSDDDTPDQIPPSPLASSDQVDWTNKRPLPDLLPEEILAAEPPTRLPTPPPRDNLVKVPTNKKRRFLEESNKPPKDIKKGNVRIRVLDDRKSILPPKVSKASQMIRETWLAGRKGPRGRGLIERRKVGAGFIRR
ncbi:MAG: hypothetical protein Q9218_003402 [Villophora microphyllina]